MAFLVAYLNFIYGCFYIVTYYLFSPEHLHVRIMYSVVLKNRVSQSNHRRNFDFGNILICF